jgi:hypothetical protein
MKNLLGYLLVILFAIGAAKFLGAVQKKEARVTQVIRDVRVLGSNASPRAATVNDRVVEGNAVRTGGDSRAELTFPDETLTRLGANTVFSFSNGGKELDLSSGAMLLAVPKSSGTVRVNTAAAVAAVTGFTGMWENGPVKKLVVLEGNARVTFKNFPNNPCRVESGQEMIWSGQPTRCPEVHDICVAQIVETSKLVTLKPLPAWSMAEIQPVINSQVCNPRSDEVNPGDLTAHDHADQKNAGPPIPTIHIPRPTRPPGSF